MKVALLIPTTTKRLQIRELTELPILSIFLPSLLRTYETNDNAGIEYILYIGYDADDEIYDNPDHLENVKDLVGKYLEKFVNGKVSIVWNRYENCQGAPCAVWNELFKEAYNDDCDYFYQLGDDITFQAKGWTTELIRMLETSPVGSGVGVVGLIDDNLRRNYLIQSFVSRKHMEIFGYYYPSVFKNWYSDPWITQVYRPYYVGVVKHNMNHNVISDENVRYKAQYEAKAFLDNEVPKGHQRIRQYLGLVPLTNCPLPVYCINMPRHIDRRQYMFKQALEKKIPLTFVDALDGWTTPKAEKFTCCRYHQDRDIDYLNPNLEFNHLNVNRRFMLFNSNLTKGEVGLALTTFHLFHEIIRTTSTTWALIIEDDVTVSDDFMEHWGQICSDLSELAARRVELVYINKEISRHKGMPELGILEKRYLPIYKGNCFNGYLVSTEGMRKLLDIYNPLIYPIDLQILPHVESYDNYPNERYREYNSLKQDLRIRAYKYHKDLVIHCEDFVSTIHDSCPYHRR